VSPCPPSLSSLSCPFPLLFLPSSSRNNADHCVLQLLRSRRHVHGLRTRRFLLHMASERETLLFRRERGPSSVFAELRAEGSRAGEGGARLRAEADRAAFVFVFSFIFLYVSLLSLISFVGPEFSIALSGFSRERREKGVHENRKECYTTRQRAGVSYRKSGSTRSSSTKASPSPSSPPCSSASPPPSP
jgi:hypothetical protein